MVLGHCVAGGVLGLPLVAELLGRGCISSVAASWGAGLRMRCGGTTGQPWTPCLDKRLAVTELQHAYPSTLPKVPVGVCNLHGSAQSPLIGREQATSVPAAHVFAARLWYAWRGEDYSI